MCTSRVNKLQTETTQSTEQIITNIMFRITKQLQISHKIRNCNNHEDLLQWYKLISNTIGITETRNILSNTFIKFKSRFPDEIINYVHESGPELIDDQTDQCPNSDAMITNTVTDKSDSKNNVVSSLRLHMMPKSICFHIASYLPTKSLLDLSMTSHTVHTTVQNTECCSYHRKQDDGVTKCTILKINSKMLDSITDNECIMECMRVPNCKEIFIEKSWNHMFQSDDCCRCPLRRLIEKVNTNNCSYDLFWFKTIWSKMEQIYIENSYSCAFDHLPMSWIFDGDVEFEKCENIRDIIRLGSAPQGSFQSSHFDNDMLMCLCKNFKDYLSKRKLVNTKIKKIRKVSRIWSDRDTDQLEMYASFDDNILGVDMEMSRHYDNSFRFETLKQFFKVFHQNVHWLEITTGERISLDDYSYNDIHTYDMYSDSNRKNNVIHKLFKRNDNYMYKLCDDLNTNEDQFPFNQFLVKYDCKNKSLPTINSLAIDVGELRIEDIEMSAIYKMFENNKLMQLFNMHNTVERLFFTLCTSFKESIDYQNVYRITELILSKLDCNQLKNIQFALVNSDRSCDEITMFYTLATQTLLQLTTLGSIKDKRICWWINSNTGITKKFTTKITIEHKDELLYKNRDALKRKITSIVNNCCNKAKKLLYGEDSSANIGIAQYFEFEKEYLV